MGGFVILMGKGRILFGGSIWLREQGAVKGRIALVSGALLAG